MSVFCFSKKQLNVEKKTRHPASFPDTGRAIMHIYWEVLNTWIAWHYSDIICQFRLCFESHWKHLINLWLWYYGICLSLLIIWTSCSPSLSIHDKKTRIFIHFIGITNYFKSNFSLLLSSWK